ncbi:selenium-dependent molybdenum cofactor biosynthesis protein YqeB [Pseudodesulfovibrio tunisiensis]|uniref:selenium-dependent molybdenum cofactor biosynthesis protein YqeB n=1 Tax=Pseudodesulfovibrio tunisiensis TaxID=463192 RepID=UPI001FB5429F|nr:selenium-dependent molybdenum cofactor biosynthesis protein YqeB [Pseudodesulfovibrio tunisiensis]
MTTFQYPIIAIRGAGDLATGVALRLYRAGLRKMVFLETEHPLAVRRTVAFSEAVYHETVTVEGVTARLIPSPDHAPEVWAEGELPVICDPKAETIPAFRPDVLVDAIIAKRNLGTNQDMASLVIGLGPGFTAGKDVHKIVETKRGHHLGRIIHSGSAAANTGIPGNIEGYTIERVYWAENDGIFVTSLDIGETVNKGDVLGSIDGVPVIAAVSGVIRGLLRNNTPVTAGAKLGDVDPRGAISYCHQASDKALAIGGGVLEAILAHLIGEDQ